MKNAFVVLTVLLCVAGLGALVHAEVAFTIPRAQQPPQLDGVLSDGEWDDAAAVTGMINQLDGVAHPRQGVFWMKYDGENIYLAHRSTVLPQEREVRAPQLWFDHDSSIVVGLAPGRMGCGDEPSHYTLRVNIDNNIRGREITWKLKGVRLTYPHPGWNPEATIESTIDDKTGTWQLEMAIPLASMNVRKMEQVEQWGIFLARDYCWGDQNAITLSTDWRFGDGRRHFGRAFYNNYRLEKEYAKARLAATDAVVQVLDLGRWREGVVQPQIAVKNTSARPVSVTAKMDIDVAFGSGNQDPPQAHVLNIKPGERVVYRFKEFGVPPGRHLLKMSVEGKDGTTYYRQEIPFDPNFGADRAEAVPDVYFQGYHFGEPHIHGWKVLLPTVYNPIKNKIYARVRIDKLAGKQKADRAEVTVRRARMLRPLFRMTMPFEGREEVSKEQDIEVLLPGVYEAVATVYARDGAVLGRSRQTFIRYDHKKDLPFLTSKTGVSDEVLPPWTPLKTERTADGLKISPWGRTYHVDSRGLFTAIDTASQSGIDAGARENILAAPVRIEAACEGKAITFKAGGLTDVAASDTKTSYRSTMTGAGWTVKTSVRLEYDGYALHTIRIEPPEGGNRRLDSLRFVVPLKSRHATHLHAAAGAWFRSSVSSITLPKRQGIVWHSGQSHGGPQGGGTPPGRGMLVGNFKPYVAISGPHRGLAFMADNDKGWVPDDQMKVSAIQVERDGDNVNLVLNLVARPFEFDHPREVTFSLQATPIRPLPEDFRARRERLCMTTAFPGRDPDGWAWNGSMLWVNGKQLIGGHGSQPYPVNWDRAKQFQDVGVRKKFGSETANTPYQSQLNLMTFPEVDDPRMPPGLQAANFYGYAYSQIAAGDMEHGNLSITRVDADYRLYHYERWINEVGLEGMYFDQTEPIIGASLNAGCGYRIDLHDRPKLHGKVQPGYLLTNVREFYRRLRTLFVHAGVEAPYLWLHTTDADMVSAFAFTDTFLEGENRPYLDADYPYISVKLPPERYQAYQNSAKWGLTMTELPMIHAGAHIRNLQGYTALHDTMATLGKFNWGGLDLNRTAIFLPYWCADVAAALRTGREDVFASAWRQDNNLMVLVFNSSSQDQAVRVEAKLNKLGMETANMTWQVADLDEVRKRGIYNWHKVDMETAHLDHDIVASTVSVPIEVKARDYRAFMVVGTRHSIIDRKISMPGYRNGALVDSIDFTAPGNYNVTLTVRSSAGESAAARCTVKVIPIPEAVQDDLTWSGAASLELMPRPEWMWGQNWVGGVPPANPTTGVLTFGSAGTDKDARLSRDWRIGGLKVQNNQGIHSIDLGGNHLTISGKLAVGASVATSNLHFCGPGTLQLGTADSPADLDIGCGGRDSRGHLSFEKGPTLEAYLNNLQIGSGTGEAVGFGELDLRGVEVAGGTLAMDGLFLGIGDGHGGQQRYGAIIIDGTTNIRALAVKKDANLGRGDVQAHGYIGDPDNDWKLPAEMNLRFGTDAHNRCYMSLGDTRNYRSSGRIIASSGGTFEGWFSKLIVGRQRTKWAKGHTATGILDLRNMTNCTLDAETLLIGILDNESNDWHAIGRVYLPPGSGRVRAATIGADGAGSEGLLHLDGTKLEITDSMVLKGEGKVTTNVNGISCGLDLSADATLTVADGGLIKIVFKRPKPGREGVYWGLRWKGDHVAELQSLAAGETPRLTWDDTSLGAEATRVFTDGGYTYVGLKLPPAGLR